MAANAQDLRASPVFWGVMAGARHCLGAGTSLAEALDNAVFRLRPRRDPAAAILLAALQQAVPMVFVGTHPPKGILGFVRLTPGFYRMVLEREGTCRSGLPLRHVELAP